MAGSRQEKIAEELRKMAATFFERESNRMSLMTVTRVTITRDFKQATVFITVLPRDKEEGALNFAKRKRNDLRTYVKKNSRFKTLPFFDIAIDEGELNRQKIDDLLENS
jgi:ribosome-binding factor A